MRLRRLSLSDPFLVCDRARRFLANPVQPLRIGEVRGACLPELGDQEVLGSLQLGVGQVPSPTDHDGQSGDIGQCEFDHAIDPAVDAAAGWHPHLNPVDDSSEVGQRLHVHERSRGVESRSCQFHRPMLVLDRIQSTRIDRDRSVGGGCLDRGECGLRPPAALRE